MFFWLVVIAIGVDLLRSFRVSGASIRGGTHQPRRRDADARSLGAPPLPRASWLHCTFCLGGVRLGAGAGSAIGELASAPRRIRSSATPDADLALAPAFRALARPIGLLPGARARATRQNGRGRSLFSTSSAAKVARLRPMPPSSGTPRVATGPVFATCRTAARPRKADPMLATTWLRALGELGDPAAMLEAAEQVSRGAPRPDSFAACSIIAGFSPSHFADCLSVSNRSCPDRCSFLDPVVADVWRATAELCAGQTQQGRARLLHSLAQGGSSRAPRDRPAARPSSARSPPTS